MSDTILVDWPAHPQIRAFTTTRMGGVSGSPFDTNNLGDHVGDAPAHIEKNRQILMTKHHLPCAPEWIHQTHSTDSVVVEKSSNRHVDAAITREPNRPLVVLTADCLPILIADQQANEVAAIHAGWRGLADGIIEKTLKNLQTPPTQLMAWIGPHLCERCFEVEADVKTIFEAHYPWSADAFRADRPQKWLMSLSQIATKILQKQGISAVYHANLCTYEKKEQFFSYRRDGQTGRIASIIWIETGQP